MCTLIIYILHPEIALKSWHYQTERDELLLAQKSKNDALQQAYELAALEGDDALGTYDPYNTKMYRGVAIVPDIIETETPSLTEGKIVGFKKRKALSGGSNPNSRKIREFVSDS